MTRRSFDYLIYCFMVLMLQFNLKYSDEEIIKKWKGEIYTKENFGESKQVIAHFLGMEIQEIIKRIHNDKNDYEYTNLNEMLQDRMKEVFKRIDTTDGIVEIGSEFAKGLRSELFTFRYKTVIRKG